MKKILYLMMTCFVLASCSKDSFVSNFEEKPEERTAKSISLVENTLTSATNGWVVTLPTSAGGAYGFYMTFNTDEDVTMYADLNDNTSTNLGTSKYRVKAGLGTDLIFDTYNYISMLADPNNSVFGGSGNTGHRSDVQFVFDKVNGDTISFLGKNYRQQLKLVKATAAQKAIYTTADGYKTAINKIKSFFATTNNPYIEVMSGNSTLKVALALNSTNTLTTGKRFNLTGVLADGKTVSAITQKYAFDAEGVTITSGGLVWQGITFVKMRWKDATTLALYDSTNKEYIIKSSVSPLVPLYQLWGTKYNGMLSEYKTIYPGTSAKGADILNYFHNGLISSITGGFNFNYGRINFVWNTTNKRVTINGLTSQNANSWTTAIIYNYTVTDAGVYKFTLNTAASGGYATNPLSRLHAFMLANTVTFDYYIDNGNLYGRMTSVEDPTIVMTFVLQ
jgi:hypothetical protein